MESRWPRAVLPVWQSYDGRAGHASAGFSAGRLVVLFEGPWLTTPLSFPYYDVTRDGQRFLMLKPADQDNAARQIVVVQNWFEELKRRKK
jgi:hypothetical protein